jgi:flagellar biosynthesis protein FlhG
MSLDQAASLRTMMKRVSRHSSTGVPRPHIFAVSGGHVGVGATTIGLNLAIALVQQGLRTVIVDADLARADLTALCSVSPTANIAEVLAGKRSIHEVLERGPGGIQLAAGCDSPQCRSLCTDRSIGRLLSQIEGLGRHAEAVVIDAGSAQSDLTSRIWQAADQVLVVTTLDAVAIMDAYTLTKSLLAAEQQAVPLSLVVNRAGSEALASDAHLRMHRSCRRFLGIGMAHAGWIPETDHSAGGESPPSPWLLRQPPPEAAHKLEQIAARLLAAQADAGRDAA